MTFKVYFNNIFYTKANAELCLLAMQGHIKSVDKTVPQIVMHPRQGHSVKPDEVMRRIEKLFGPDTKKLNCLLEEHLMVGMLVVLIVKFLEILMKLKTKINF